MKGRLKLKYINSSFCDISDLDVENNTARKMKFSINNLFSKYDYIRTRYYISLQNLLDPKETANLVTFTEEIINGESSRKEAFT